MERTCGCHERKRTDKETRNQILNLATETVKVDRALDYNVKPPMSEFSLEDMARVAGPEGNEKLDKVLQGNPPKVPGRPSLSQDVIKGRKTEIEYLNGMVSKKGEGDRNTNSL